MNIILKQPTWPSVTHLHSDRQGLVYGHNNLGHVHLTSSWVVRGIIPSSSNPWSCAQNINCKSHWSESWQGRSETRGHFEGLLCERQRSVSSIYMEFGYIFTKQQEIWLIWIYFKSEISLCLKRKQHYDHQSLACWPDDPIYTWLWLFHLFKSQGITANVCTRAWEWSTPSKTSWQKSDPGRQVTPDST